VLLKHVWCRRRLRWQIDSHPCQVLHLRVELVHLLLMFLMLPLLMLLLLHVLLTGSELIAGLLEDVSTAAELVHVIQTLLFLKKSRPQDLVVIELLLLLLLLLLCSCPVSLVGLGSCKCIHPRSTRGRGSWGGLLGLKAWRGVGRHVPDLDMQIGRSALLVGRQYKEPLPRGSWRGHPTGLGVWG